MFVIGLAVHSVVVVVIGAGAAMSVVAAPAVSMARRTSPRKIMRAKRNTDDWIAKHGLKASHSLPTPHSRKWVFLVMEAQVIHYHATRHK